LGDVLISKPHENLVEQRIRGVDMDEPLFTFIESENRREAVLFGENIWKWRMQTYRDTGSFEHFDAFWSKVVFFLANSSDNRRFTLEYEKMFQGSREARVRASFFDKTFNFNSNASLAITVKSAGNGPEKEVPMLLKGSYYEADLSDLPPGTYSFEARVEGEDFRETGNFSILDFEVEKQLLATDYRKLGRLAENTGAGLYFPGELDSLIHELTENDRFLPVQKSEQIVVSLIDFRWLLALIAASLAAEWFIRKYNGLI
jgi:hypothetical protein